MPPVRSTTATDEEIRLPLGGSFVITDEIGTELFRVTADGDAVKVAGLAVNAATTVPGITASAAEINALTGQGAVAADVAKLHAVGATAVEINRLVGTTAPPVQVVERTFVETAGDGTFTATVAIPAGVTVLDVIFRNTVVWSAGTSASLVVGDDDDPDGYIEATDVKTAPIANVSGGGAGISTRLSLGATAGAYKGGGGKFCATAKTITAAIAKVGNGNAGRSRLIVEYALPSTAAAVKA